jgi:hypothetical protein
MDRPLIWLTGETTDADFASAVAWLKSVAACEVVIAAEPLPSEAGAPAAIVLLQLRPGVLCQTHIETLHLRAPLARIISFVGPWCDGELRSGRPSHGVTRIHWHQWRLRLPQELGLVAGASPSARLPPRTLTEVDRLVATKIMPGPRHAVRGTVAIHTCRRESYHALADACSLAGLVPLWDDDRGPPEVHQPSVRLFDGWASLADCEGRADESPAILLLDWPRPDDLHRAEQLGIGHVLAQPLLITDLLAALDELLPAGSAATSANTAA